MRKIINSTYMTLDGAVDRPDLWSLEYFDEDAAKFASEQLFGSDVMLMGRETYEGFAESWPGREGDFADQFNGMRKIVVSDSLDSAEWNNTTVIKRADLVKTITELKQTDGKDILMYGFGPVARALVEEGLLDELRLWFIPVFFGNANPDSLLVSDGFKSAWKPADATTHASGTVVITYQPA